MNMRTRWLLIGLIAVFGHFIDGWTNPSYVSTPGWWLWHAVNWMSRDVILVVLLWPLIMGPTIFYEVFERTKWRACTAPRFDTPEKIAWWTLAAVANFMLHHALYWLAENTRSILQ